MNFQSPATPLMEVIVDLHHDIMGILIIIFSVVVFSMDIFFFRFEAPVNQNVYRVTHNTF